MARRAALLAGLLVPAMAAVAQAQDQACKAGPQLRAVTALEARLAKERTQAGQAVAQCVADVEARTAKGVQEINDCGPCSAADKEQNLAQLREIKERTLKKCQSKRVEAESASLAREKATHLARQRQLRDQFQGLTRGYGSWGKDAQAGFDDTEKKIGELVLMPVFAVMATQPNEVALERVDELRARTSSLRDVRRVKTGELREFVVSIQGELRGKSKDQAKRIVFDRLRGERRYIEDLSTVEERLAPFMARATLSDDAKGATEHELAPALEVSYQAILGGTEIAYTHGVKAVGSLAKAAGVLALFPDMIDAAVLLLRGHAGQANLDGLDQLQAAAELQRSVTACELQVLIAARKRQGAS
jgi:hypothetical protein